MSIKVESRLALCGLLALCWPLVTGSIDHRGSFDDRLLAAHNRERALLGIPPLRWNAQLAVGAQQWSDHLARTGTFAHSPDGPDTVPLGENIWGGTPDRFEPEQMVGLWLREKQHFRPGRFPDNSRTSDVTDVAHYTQLVWRDTREVGCALSRGDEAILVCRYSKPGNIMGQSVY